ncbi:hypothetical protein [Spongiactinospora gelatinilytica]|nr:hypothetical protein [Spongiactinospora gelatinilytica]
MLRTDNFAPAVEAPPGAGWHRWAVLLAGAAAAAFGVRELRHATR